MKIPFMSKTQRLCFSAMVMAIYIVLMYVSQGISFGQFQVRFATSIYALAYIFPFLTLPLALANLLSNLLMGGLGLFDILGGGLVGLLTAGSCALLGSRAIKPWSVFLPIALIPAFGVSLWLSPILNVPYLIMSASLLVGQCVAGVLGAILCRALCNIWKIN